MVEIRVAFEDGVGVHGLMRRLAGLFGRSAISFDRARNEVRVESEWESRAIVAIIDVVESWVDEEGGAGATLSIGENSYLVAGRGSLSASP